MFINEYNQYDCSEHDHLVLVNLKKNKKNGKAIFCLENDLFKDNLSFFFRLLTLANSYYFNADKTFFSSVKQYLFFCLQQY